MCAARLGILLQSYAKPWWEHTNEPEIMQIFGMNI